MPVLGCCKGILAYSAPSAPLTYVWDASILSSVLKSDGNPVVNDGDQVKYWQPSLGSIQTNTTFSRFTAGTLWPTLTTLSSKKAIDIPSSVLMSMSNSVIPGINITMFIALRWMTGTGDYIPMSYTTPNFNSGSCCLYQFNSTRSVYIKPSQYSINTFTPISGTLYIYAYSYNTVNNQFKLIVTNSNIYNITSNQTTNLSQSNCHFNLAGVKMNDSGNSSWNVRIAVHEVRLYNGIMLDSEIESVKTDLINKWI
jgi:hypothetical protein